MNCAPTVMRSLFFLRAPCGAAGAAGASIGKSSRTKDDCDSCITPARSGCSASLFFSRKPLLA